MKTPSVELAAIAVRIVKQQIRACEIRIADAEAVIEKQTDERDALRANLESLEANLRDARREARRT